MIKAGNGHASVNWGLLLLWCALGIALILLVPFLATVPGLHGDEAWAGVRAYEITEGSRVMLGMNRYTGPQHGYLLAGFLSVFGFSVTALRLVTGISFLVSVVLYYFVAKRLFNPFIAGISVVLLVTLPAFTVYGRAALEIFALNPVLSLGAILLLLEARELNNKMHYALCWLAGVCLGLGIWNHLIFLSVPVAILVAAVLRYPSVLKKLSFYVVGYGVLLALMPRLYYEAGHPAYYGGGVAGMNPDQIGGLLKRLSEWPGLLVQMVYGDPIFHKYSGEVRLGCPNVIWGILVAGFIAHLKNRGFKWSSSGWLTFLYGLVLFLMTVVLCQRNVDQYFLLLLYLAPLVLACAFVELAESGIPRVLVCCVAVGFVALQLVRTGENYFVSQIKSGGRIHDFQFGSEWLTSDNSIRTDRLYEQLVKLGAKRIYAEFFIAMPLRYYDQEKHNFDNVSIVSGGEAPSEYQEDTYAVVYVGGIRRAKESDYEEYTTISKDDHFCIMKAPSK